MNRKSYLHAIGEIIFAIAVIVLVYFLLQFLERRNTRAAIELTEASTQKIEEVQADNYGTVVLGTRQYILSHPVKTYLFLGTDASGNEDGTGEEYRGSMADVLMLAVIDQEEQSYGFLQLNRDTITRVPLMQVDGSANASARLQLCTAHWYGGDKKASCENTVTTVSEMLGGIPIDGYYALSMDAMEKLNQAVGGVTVTFSEDLTELDPAMEEGATITLTDEQAVKLLHARYEMTDDRNTERMERQRIFFDAFLGQVKERQEGDNDFVIKLYDSLHPYATEDININEITKLMHQADGYTSKGVYTIDGESEIGQRLGDGLDHWEFYMDEASLDSTMQALFPLVYEGEWEEEYEE